MLHSPRKRRAWTENHPQTHFWAHCWPWEQEGRVKSRKKKQRNKTHLLLRNSRRASSHKCRATTSKQNSLKLSLAGQQANKPARKRGLLHRLGLVCWFFHTLQPQLARQIYQLARQTWITYTNNINLFAPPNAIVRLHFSFQTSVSMYHLQHLPHSHTPLLATGNSMLHHYDAGVTSPSTAAHIPVDPRSCGTDLLTSTLLPGSTLPPSPACLQAPATRAHSLPVRSLLHHLQAAARRAVPLPGHCHPVAAV